MKSADKPCGTINICEKHQWVVYSTALQEVWLMLQCVRCGTHGTVNDPTADEWSSAFHAPTSPYQWDDESRVTKRGMGPLLLVERQPGIPCECIQNGLVKSPVKYERVPGGIITPDRQLNRHDRQDLMSLAGAARSGSLCGRLLAFFLDVIQKDTRHEPSAVARQLAQRIEDWDRNGLHMSPGVVAYILQQWAESP